ncbi:MAG: hypothetical protein A4S08_10020 [Proteobacteria bacterium SG_bin4]|nr:MAG: hypothetical protein A4S08_10020 [Proteobacteria bacterium SG_bin4]
MQRVVPALRVTDYPVSQDFYAKLGFREDWRHVFEEGLPIFAAISLREMQIFLTEHSGDCSSGGLVHFYIDNVDSYYEQVRLKVDVEQPPSNSLGSDLRDMAIRDPDGNRLVFLSKT